jgi:hypothetical protein
MHIHCLILADCFQKGESDAIIELIFRAYVHSLGEVNFIQGMHFT